MSDDKASLPTEGEQITFEKGDCKGVHESMTLRVREVHPQGFGMIELTGWEIGTGGWPVGEAEVRLYVPVATVEARRLHRGIRKGIAFQHGTET